MAQTEYKSLEEFISSSTDNNITYFNLSFITRIKDGENSIEISRSILNDYIKELKAASVIVKMDELDFIKYAYKPELLAYDVYGNTELYFIILLLNGLSSPKEFNLKKLKMLTKENCINYLNTIYNSEENVINTNRRKEREE